MNKSVIKTAPVLYGDGGLNGANYKLVEDKESYTCKYWIGMENGNVSNGLRGNGSLKTEDDAIKGFDKKVNDGNNHRKNIKLFDAPDDMFGYSKEYGYERSIITKRLKDVVKNPNSFIHGSGFFESFIILTGHVPMSREEMNAGPGAGLNDRGAIGFKSLDEMVRLVKEKLNEKN